jgi:hypothetical protein
MGIHDEAIELQLADRALHFLHGALRVLRRERGKARITLRVTSDHLGQPVIRELRHGDRRCRVEQLHSRRSQGEDVHGHAITIHYLEPLAVSVQQSAAQGGERPCHRASGRRGSRRATLARRSAAQVPHVEIVPGAARQSSDGVALLGNRPCLLSGDSTEIPLAGFATARGTRHSRRRRRGRHCGARTQNLSTADSHTRKPPCQKRTRTPAV